MALTAEGAQLTSAFRTNQLALRASTMLDLHRLWGLFDPATPGSYDAFVQAATGLIRLRHSDSTQIAAAYLRTFREAEGISGKVPAFRLAEAPLLDQVAIALRATGLAGTVRALRAGQTLTQALKTGLVQADGATARLVLDGGRSTVAAFAAADPRAKGWIRVTSGDPCAFCAMLSSRGAAYSRERSARFQAHDHCGCTAEPFYGGALPEQTQRFAEMWKVGRGSGSGPDAIREFRRAYDGGELADVGA